MITNLDWFDIVSTVQCGQLFRYQMLDVQSCKIISKNKICLVKQNNKSVEINTDEIDYFYNYFDTFVDYNQILATLNQFEELHKPIEFGKGIRILRQDLLETIISFMISSNNNITRIRNTIENLSKNHGSAINNIENKGFNIEQCYAFPTIEQLLQVTTSQWKSYGAGYRAEYLVETIQNIYANNIIDKLNLLKLEYDSLQNKQFQQKNADLLRTKKLDIQSQTYLIKNQVYQILLSLKGIGPKVADCIMLFGLQFADSFPVDTWIFNSLKTNTLNTKQKIRDYYLNRYGSLCGYAQQYIFYFNRSKA